MKTNSNLSKNATVDAGLIADARSGVENAFSQLLYRYKDAIYFMLLKMVNNRTDAEDLTIEAFEKAFSSINQYDPQYAFSTWLFSIASNNAVDYMRRKKVGVLPLDSAFGNEKRSGVELLVSKQNNTDNPEEEFIKRQNAKIVRMAVSALKPRYRTVLEMRYFKEYSYSEISEALNLPLGTVKVQLFRSREMLYDLLKNTEMGNRLMNPGQYIN